MFLFFFSHCGWDGRTMNQNENQFVGMFTDSFMT
jgi:hypothetical protein